MIETTILLFLFGIQLLEVALLVALYLLMRPLLRAMKPIAPMLTASAALARVADDLKRMAGAAQRTTDPQGRRGAEEASRPRVVPKGVH